MNGVDEFRGRTEVEIEHILKDISEIKDDIRFIRQELGNLRYFKAKVYGASLTVSFLVPLALQWLFSHL